MARLLTSEPGSDAMAKAKDVTKGMVVALEGGYWVIEEYHSQHQGRRGAVLHIKMRNLKSGHVIDRTFGEGAVRQSGWAVLPSPS